MTPKHPFIYEINTWVWLDELSGREATPVDLARVPATEWDAIAALGFDVVWLMGVWERSPAGIAMALENAGLMESFRRALPDFQTEDVVGSPYCIRDYTVDAHLGRPGGPGGCARGARRARRRVDPRLRAEPRRARPPVDRGASRVLRAWERRGPRARSGVVHARRRQRAGERPRPVLRRLAGRRAAERVLARPARSRDRDAELDRRAVRRRSLRHGDADDERHLRAHLGRARRQRGPRTTTGRR